MQEATISKIATEALKPVSSVIDALLGPKLERIRNWSEKQELSSKLASGHVDVLLDRYLRRLLRRICGVTTIVFPQQILPLTSIYEPLTLEPRYKRNASQEQSSFNVRTLEEGHNYFIVDSAGMGKSTFAKHFVLELLDLTTKIPMFLELRRIGNDETLLGKLSAEMAETKNEIDERFLLMLLDEGDFILILDGYDEIAEQSRESIGQQITQLALQCENLQIILTARPEVSLPELPDSMVFTIEPLTRTQAESLVLRYDAVANIEVGSKLIAQFDVVSERFLETPLLVVLLYRTYGFNQSIATRITSFYDEVFNALYKGHDLSKAGFSRLKVSRLDAEDFRRLLRGFSFLLAARQKDNLKSRTEGVTIVDEAIRLTSVHPSSPSAFFDDLLLAVPLLTQEGTDYRFIHRSLGEFFAAEFLSYQPNSEPIIERIRDGNLYPSFINSFQYLSEINPTLFRRLIVAPLAKSILESPIRSPHTLTLRFLTSALLGLWSSDRYLESVGDESIARPPKQHASFSSLSWIEGRFKGAPVFIAISFVGGFRKFPIAAWEALSEVIQKNLDDQDSEYDFDFLENVVEVNQWIPIDDERILNIADHPTLTQLFHQTIDFATSLYLIDRTKGRSEEQDILRILSVRSCNELLQQIRQEDETQSWLEALVAGDNDPNISS